MNGKVKIAFIASSGGHFEQLLMLKTLMNKYDSFVVTEKTKYSVKPANINTFYLKQVNRKEIKFIPNMIVNFLKSLYILYKEKPNVVVSTGVLAMIPLCLLCKLRGGKLVYIESFAKISSPTLTGKFLYKYADQFYIQWESMREFYPDAIYVGGIY